MKKKKSVTAMGRRPKLNEEPVKKKSQGEGRMTEEANKVAANYAKGGSQQPKLKTGQDAPKMVRDERVSEPGVLGPWPVVR